MQISASPKKTHFSQDPPKKNPDRPICREILVRNEEASVNCARLGARQRTMFLTETEIPLLPVPGPPHDETVNESRTKKLKKTINRKFRKTIIWTWQHTAYRTKPGTAVQSAIKPVELQRHGPNRTKSSWLIEVHDRIFACDLREQNASNALKEKFISHFSLHHFCDFFFRHFRSLD